jgi:hypothetical protein
LSRVPDPFRSSVRKMHFRVRTPPTSAMPLLWRSYGHHRDLSAGGSGARATIIVSLHRHDGVMMHHDESQPPVETVALRPAVRRAPASITSPMTATTTAGSLPPPSSHRTRAALAHRNHHRAPRVNRAAQSPRRLNSPTRILKSP